MRVVILLEDGKVAEVLSEEYLTVLLVEDCNYEEGEISHEPPHPTMVSEYFVRAGAGA